MLRVALCGAQDTGKTTLARGLASHFSAAGFIAEYVPEYAREFIGQYGPIDSTELLVTIKQMEKELLVSPKAHVMFTDSPVFLTYIYTLHTCDSADPRLWVTLETIRQLLNRHPPYDLIIHLTPFREPRADGIRPAELIASNALIAQRIKGFLDLFAMPYITLKGTDLARRMEEAKALVASLLD